MMDPGETTVAEILHGAGYATGIFGKWHLGDCHPMRPVDQGFEEALVLRGGGIGQPSDPPGGERKYTDPVLFHNGKRVDCTGYCTDVYFDSALDWIEKNHRAGRSFFTYIPTNAPHGPFNDVPAGLLAGYEQMDLGNDRFPQEKGRKLPEKANADKRARIFSMITNVDENVGRLFERLETLGITDNTIVIFMVDNGPNGRRYVAGMRGMKSEVHEGGIRSPFFVHWPARLAAGQSSDRVAAHIDVLPTLLDACGVEKPADLKLDGRSLLPLLAGKAAQWPDRTVVIQAHRGNVPVKFHHFAARGQKWKLVHPSGFGKESFEGDPRFELYDMEADPLEEHDLAAERPDVLAKLVADYEAWWDDVGSTRPDNYAPPRIHIGTVHENPTVLTRQDWRHDKGGLWAADSNGFWELFAARTGRYRFRLRFPEMKADGEAMLRIDARSITRSLAAGATECVFEDIEIKAGDLRFQAVLLAGDEARGPMMADVFGPE